jgi:hypothetical protein
VFESVSPCILQRYFCECRKENYGQRQEENGIVEREEILQREDVPRVARVETRSAMSPEPRQAALMTPMRQMTTQSLRSGE